MSNALNKATPINNDYLTVLTCSNNLVLTKVFDGDTVTPYDRAKHFAINTLPVTDIHTLSAVLTTLQKKRHKCVIRGAFIGDAKAQLILPPSRPGMYQRSLQLFYDAAHHWVLFDVDKYEFPRDWTWQQAIEMFILEKLPEPFVGATYHYTLSSSCGRTPGVLKVRLAFWLDTPYSSEHLRAWAKHEKLAVDTALFNPVQVHYTAAPVFAGGAVDPITGPRCALVPGETDSVPLVLDPLEVMVPEQMIRDASRGMPDACAKPGWIGAFCRAYPAEDVVDRFLTHVFEWENDTGGLGHQRRLTFLLGSGAPGGAFVTDDGYHVVNKHDSDPFENRAVNSFDLVRHYQFGHLDDGLPKDTPMKLLPSYAEMNKFCRQDAKVREELEKEQTQVTADIYDNYFGTGRSVYATAVQPDVL